jgi:pimeloyl-ACP methyl ester carboxylesterase
MVLGVAVAIGAMFIAPSQAQETAMTRNSALQTVEVNGIALAFASYGSGDPIILLHGGLGSQDMFADILPLLFSAKRVVSVDLQGHGGTADIERDMSYEAMADDVAALITTLGLGAPDVLGFSMGGSVGARLAIQHPEIVGRLVLVSTPFARDGWHQENLDGMAQTTSEAAEYLKETPLYQLYSSAAPRLEDWPRLLDKVAALTAKDYDWSTEIAAIKSPTMLIYGDWDAVRISHAGRFFELLGGGLHDALWDGSNMNENRMVVLPGATHYTIFSDPRLAREALAFFDAE